MTGPPPWSSVHPDRPQRELHDQIDVDVAQAQAVAESAVDARANLEAAAKVGRRPGHARVDLLGIDRAAAGEVNRGLCRRAGSRRRPSNPRKRQLTSAMTLSTPGDHAYLSAADSTKSRPVSFQRFHGSRVPKASFCGGSRSSGTIGTPIERNPWNYWNPGTLEPFDQVSGGLRAVVVLHPRAHRHRRLLHLRVVGHFVDS